jgi:hypothetical protein
MPLGLLAVGSALQDEHVVIVDGRLELAPGARVGELVREADVLGVTVRSGRPLRDALRVSEAARAANPRLRIVWGGAHATLRPAQCLASGAVDACVVGAGEDAFVECLAAVRAGRSLDGVGGVATLASAATEPLSPPAPHDTPAAHYPLLDLDRYFDVRGGRRLDFCSSRGRPTAPGGDWWALPAERVAAEVGELAERYRPLTILFQDRAFFAEPGRASRIAETLANLHPRVGWEAGARPADLLGMGVDGLHLVRESGCARIHVLVPTGALLLGRNRAAVLETAELLRGAGLAGRFVLEVDPPRPGHDTLKAAASLARALMRVDPGFQTPLERRRLYPPEEDHDSEAFPEELEGWAAREEAPWPDRRAERRLARRAFYIGHAQKPPGGGPGQRLVRILARWRMRMGVFALDLERSAVELSGFLRTGRVRRVPAEGHAGPSDR